MKSEMVNINCEIVRDLIPLCSEGLCSEVSTQEIRKHIETCESCRKLYEQLPETEVPAALPDESKAFRKIRKKMKRSRLKIALLSVALAAVVIPVWYLSVGQILKIPEMQSFETVWQSFEVRQLVKKLAEGDIEGYMAESSWGDCYEINAIDFSIMDYAVIREQDTENLQRAYEAAFGDSKVEQIKVDSEYVGTAAEGLYSVYSRAIITYENGRQMMVDFTKREDGLYSGTYMGAASTQEMLNFQKALDYADEHELVPRGWFEELLKTGETPLTEGQINYAMPGILERFTESYHTQVEESVTAFYQKGYLVDNCILTLRYDDEKQMLYHDTVIIARDGNGTAVMQTRLYSTYEGLIPPEDDMTTIYTDSCSDALAEDLANLFG